jgi:hypothetical protein
VRRRAAIGVALAGLAACVAAVVYLDAVAPDSEWSGGDLLLVGWNLVPFLLLAGVVLVSRVSIPAVALATLLMAGFVIFAFWADASDLNSSDPSSTGVIILGIGPFYDVVLIGIVCGVDAVVRKLAAR